MPIFAWYCIAPFLERANIIEGMSGACLGQHLGHFVNNGQQSAVLHASVFGGFDAKSSQDDSPLDVKRLSSASGNREKIEKIMKYKILSHQRSIVIVALLRRESIMQRALVQF